MLSLGEPMTLGQRLLVYWSWLWRQLLVGVPIWLVATVSGIVWTLSRLHAGYFPTAAKTLPLLVEVVAVLAATIPVSGYMARKAFVIHGFSAPMRLRFKDATTLGLEAMTWGLAGTLVTVLPAHSLRMWGHTTLALILNMVVGVLVSLFVVLPRLALRLRRLSRTEQ
ncbi:hypothetical protein VSR68_09900 [Paraburkholderia phymatum]|uniref:hypothetical protein n=1 Tax=Paraburkholderia phymatum TaxID=148447 RepID=UPI0031703237